MTGKPLAVALACTLLSGPACGQVTTGQPDVMPSGWDENMRSVFVDNDGHLRSDPEIRTRFAALDRRSRDMIHKDCDSAPAKGQSEISGLFTMGRACAPITTMD